jgi:aminopeptidase N
VAGGAWSGPVESAVGVDDPDVVGVGDPGLADLGDPATDVGHYHLDLTVDPTSGAITEGVAVIELGAVDDLEEVSLDLAGLTVEAVAVDGDPAAARRDGPRLVVPVELAEGDRATVTVCYSGTPEPVASAALFDVPVGWQLATDGVFVLAEPEGARTWFPVDDHPTDKATYTIEVTVPDGWVAVANGVGGATATVDPDGGSTHRWEMRQPMAPYLATVLVGRFERTELSAVGGVPVDVWAVEGAPSGAVEVLSAQSEVLDVLVGLFGPYPFDDLGSALLPGRALGHGLLDRVALETQGLSIYGLGAVSEATLVHETAHQWFGNSVTLTSWTRDLWWVEGLATYAQWLHAEQLHGRGAYDAEVASARRTVDRLDGEIGDLDPTDLFGTLAYQGGALVFAALRDEVGEDDLLEVLRTFAERHRHANATTDDLVAVASEVAGRDLARFFAAWLGPARDRPSA